MLAARGLLLPADEEQRLERDLLAQGRALLDTALPGGGGGLRGAARSLRLSDAALARALGHGALQAGALARAAGASDGALGSASRLGALFNLGVSLFDRLCDGFPERADALWSAITPDSLAAPRLLEGAMAREGDPAVAGLLPLVAALLDGVATLPAGRAGAERFLDLLVTMHAAERLSLAPRHAGRPSLSVLRALRRKSVLPSCALAHLALCAAPASDPGLLRNQALRAGTALWIVDDLVDLGEDLSAGSWSRLLWLLARRGEPLVARAGQAADPEALHRLLLDGEARPLLHAESARLAAALAAIQLPGLRRATCLAVGSWLALPRNAR